MIRPFVKPFAALRPASGRAAEVVAPPYDVPTVEEARTLAAGNPASFLHVSRPEINLLPGVDPHCDMAYDMAGRAMRRLLDEGVLVRDAAPGYSAYRLDAGDHVQTGIALAADVAAYESGRIRRHEFTREVKEIDRARHIQAVGAHTGPVFTTHRPSPALAAVIAPAMSGDPVTDVTAPDGVRHRVWAVTDADAIAAVTAAFEAMPTVYVADGHHRSAAAVRVARQRRAAGATDERFLVVSFPADEVRILDYNRVVRDLNGRSADDFVEALGDTFDVRPAEAPVRPDRRGVFGLVVDGRWYRLALRQAPPADMRPVDRLDISVLGRTVLEPLLAIDDPRSDPRIDFVGGARGLDELTERVVSGTWAAAFSLYPTALEDLMAVADAGEVMPPKSTWFEPKLADGLISLPLE